jgi:GGDEF domain-containing protein
MSLLGPLVVVAEEPAPDLVEALAAAGGFPVVESRWADAPAAFTSIQPAAIVVAEPGPASDAEAAQMLGLQLRTRNGPFVPLIGRSRRDRMPAIPEGLPIDADASTERLVARLRSALRVRALHTTVLRRAETFAAQTGRTVKFPDNDPLDDATILVTGRGGSYPDLAVAVGERVGLIGALSIETAAHYLNARPIDGIIIGDGFSARLIEGFLAALKDDPRFRDMPIAALDMKLPIEPFHNALPNLERIAGGPPQVLDWVLPLARMRAFEARLKRMLKTIDANGMLDPDTGVLTDDSFAHEFARAVDDAARQGHGLCIARFAFDVGLDPRISLDAARLIGAAIRTVDFACRENDGAVLMVFTETELQEAHLVARRIATMLKKTMLVGDRRASHPPTGITLATLKADDTPETLLRRIGSRAVAATLVPA